ncbi:MAG TPA: thiamine phosphate synthase [Anaeromyxobacter sp.]|nr:thiamine phosphate synthase [Anaeromyxobacter sp.]
MPGSGLTAAERRARLTGLYAIVGGEQAVAQAEAAIDGGAAVVQVRMKAAPPGEVLEVSRRVVAAARGRALVLVNDRADLALLSGADGVHVGEDDLPVRECRALLGPDRLVGWTAKTVAEAREGVLAGADHIGFGPVFVSRTKAMGPPPHGIDGLAEAVRALRPVPVVAISGIGLDNIAAVARAGAASAAVIEAIFGAGDPRANAAALRKAFETGAQGRGPEAGLHGKRE